ncbi:hypothetical protein CC79DRAFT_1272988 [Sarocladium strictum]
MVNTPEEAAKLLLARHDLSLTSIRTLVSLWAGYGSICSVTARAGSDEAAATMADHIPLILKFISPPKAKKGDEGHLRKTFSYEVEQHFYGQITRSLPDNVKVAKCLASTGMTQDRMEGVVAMLMEDLRVSFDVAGGKRANLQPSQVYAALDWLARFHQTTKSLCPKDSRDRFVLPPLEEAKRRDSGDGGDKVWLNGGYTYLATRQKEFTDLKHDASSEWSATFCKVQPTLGCNIAEAVARVLTPRGRAAESYIHGDVKSENLFTTKQGDKVAFFDFQYVGLGLGVCDLAKLFTCSLPISMLGNDGEEVIPASAEELDLLRRYRETVAAGRDSIEYNEEEFRRHWECALVDWCRFQASWGFWGNTEWLEGRVRWILRDPEWLQWLKNDLNSIDRGS